MWGAEKLPSRGLEARERQGGHMVGAAERPKQGIQDVVSHVFLELWQLQGGRRAGWRQGEEAAGACSSWGAWRPPRPPASARLLDPSLRSPAPVPGAPCQDCSVSASPRSPLWSRDLPLPSSTARAPVPLFCAWRQQKNTAPYLEPVPFNPWQMFVDDC